MFGAVVIETVIHVGWTESTLPNSITLCDSNTALDQPLPSTHRARTKCWATNDNCGKTQYFVDTVGCTFWYFTFNKIYPLLSYHITLTDDPPLLNHHTMMLPYCVVTSRCLTDPPLLNHHTILPYYDAPLLSRYITFFDGSTLIGSSPQPSDDSPLSFPLPQYPPFGRQMSHRVRRTQ